jgi:hypothetical protein
MEYRYEPVEHDPVQFPSPGLEHFFSLGAPDLLSCDPAQSSLIEDDNLCKAP